MAEKMFGMTLSEQKEFMRLLSKGKIKLGE
jgi:hypothetical protein